jgi:hypothetical protein
LFFLNLYNFLDVNIVYGANLAATFVPGAPLSSSLILAPLSIVNNLNQQWTISGGFITSAAPVLSPFPSHFCCPQILSVITFRQWH